MYNDLMKKHHNVRSWVILLGTMLLLWIFAVSFGPWLKNHIPVYDKIVQVILERDIDSGAYFYTEIKGSYEGESYLRQALQTGAHGKYWGLTWPFLLGIASCIAILAFGYRFLPNEEIKPDNEPKDDATRP